MIIDPENMWNNNEDRDKDEATKQELERVMRMIQSHIKKTAKESSKRFLSRLGL